MLDIYCIYCMRETVKSTFATLRIYGYTLQKNLCFFYKNNLLQ